LKLFILEVIFIRFSFSEYTILKVIFVTSLFLKWIILEVISKFTNSFWNYLFHK